MKKPEKTNTEMGRTKHAKKQYQFFWCSFFQHSRHVLVCEARCERASYCDILREQKERMNQNDR